MFHDKWALLAVCRVKNRPIGDFSGFYARSGANCWQFAAFVIEGFLTLSSLFSNNQHTK
jgi:hypothetical protein